MNLSLEARTDVNFVPYWRGVKDSYSPNARTFVDFYVAGNYQKIDDCVKDYFSWLDTQSHYRAATIRIKRLAALDRVRRVLRLLPDAERRTAELILDDIRREIPPPKLPTMRAGREKIITLADWYKLRDTVRSKRQRAFIRFLFATGVRVSEMAGIRLSDCTILAGFVHVRVMGKGRRERFVQIKESHFQEIREVFHGVEYLFETRGAKPYSRTYITSEIRKVTLRVLGRALSSHKMRHSFATLQAERHVPIDALADYLGHKDPALTMRIYTHSQMTQADLFADDI